ncbi:hypothetical protein MMC06_006653, partial [Schaereria dolodes]|nr:hypothetical protein [Schaereria dolodes]
TSPNSAFLLAALTAGGGITGYIRTGSVPSIAAGLTVGALVNNPPPFFIPVAPLRPNSTNPAFLSPQQYGLGGYRIQTRQPYGIELALLASVILAGSSVPRALRTQKLLPVGLSVVAAYGLWEFGGRWNAGRG